MLAVSIDFQSISFTEPVLIAWAKLYIALDASSALAPDKAATLATPLIAIVESSRDIPAFVNFEMFLVMSPKEYMVLSEYSFNFSSWVFTSSRLTLIP